MGTETGAGRWFESATELVRALERIRDLEEHMGSGPPEDEMREIAREALRVDGMKVRDPGLYEAALRRIADLAIEVLDAEREAAGVDEWDESDTRCNLYNAAWAVREERLEDVLTS